MKKLTSAFIFLLGISASAASYEIRQMNQILKHIDKDTLVVLDVDNTIAESVQTIGSVQWQEHEVEKAKEQGLSTNQALERSLRKFIAVSYVSLMRPVEPATPTLLRNIQQKSAGVMALTARPAELLARTRFLLGKLGIDLSLARPIDGNLQTVAKEQSIYSKGILAVGATNDKGEMLKWLISQNGFVPFKKVVFVDDKVKYTKSISTALDSLGVINDVFRYGAADQRVKSFDPALADEQTEYFEVTGKILGDE
ncbi:MAG: hypothetical protein A4S09_05990 [Proteobacteria bacterium SG_bin7]|nr:MAG: hypothetical protein A4S09_05990 [Proteobacteria bacterium SG_bin7]